MTKESDKIRASAHNKSKTLAIDFDGVIHSYRRGWTGETPIDGPMPGIEDALKELKSQGWSLVIMSTRNPEKIMEWLDFYGLVDYFDDITNTKIPAKLYIDDRGYHFQNWEDTINFVKDFRDRYDN